MWGVLIVCVTSAAGAQSLGDLARKEQERRKTVTPGKVYTNDDLRAAPPGSPVTAVPSSPAPDAPSASQGETPAGETPAAADTVRKDEAYWRERLQAERNAVERAAVLLGALQSRVDALQTDFVNRDDPAARAIITVERQRALAELDRTKQEIQQHTQAIADIQEQARRAGVPAAWYR
jgi:hypothetical protein